MISNYFETSVNWRIAKYYFRHPAANIEFADEVKPKLGDHSVFIPQNNSFDIIAMRDWLHDCDNNTEGYVMIGCFDIVNSRYRVVLTGLRFFFERALDAVYFRLRWTCL